MPFLTDTPISSIVIAGSGGFGSELFDYISGDCAQGGPAIAGFIDDTPGGRVPPGVELPWLGPIGEFKPADAQQVVVVAIGSVKGREAVLGLLQAAGVPVPAYVAGDVRVSPSARIGAGSVVCPFSIINRDAELGTGVVVNVMSSIGHGAKVGDFSVLSPYAALNGDACVGARCFLGTRATIYPRIHIGDDCTVDSHTGVRSTVADRQLISSRGTYRVTPMRIPR